MLTLAFDNPVAISTPLGEILALTKSLDGWHPDEMWESRITTKRIPSKVLNDAQCDSEGRVQPDWTTTATVFSNPSSNRYLGGYITNDHTPVACLSVSEAKHPFGSNDVKLAQSTINMLSHDPGFLDSVGISVEQETTFAKLIGGKLVDNLEINHFENSVPAGPWQVVAFCNTARKDAMHRSSLVATLRTLAPKMQVTALDDSVVALSPANSLDHFLEKCADAGLVGTHRLVVSSPFTEISLCPHAFGQCRALNVMADRGLPPATSGVVLCDSDGASLSAAQLLSLQPCAADIVHPAVALLAAYDASHGTDLLATLEAYLENERSIKRTAAALFVHRNSLMYRIGRICDLCALDLDDVSTRKLLLLSLELRKHDEKAYRNHR